MRLFLSGWGDLNPRLLDPEPSALPLRYSPILPFLYQVKGYGSDGT